MLAIVVYDAYLLTFVGEQDYVTASGIVVRQRQLLHTNFGLSENYLLLRKFSLKNTIFGAGNLMLG